LAGDGHDDVAVVGEVSAAAGALDDPRCRSSELLTRYGQTTVTGEVRW